MSHYLFSSAVQGIQSFIFQTNRLREIVGASEVVNDICTTFFKQVLTECGLSFRDDACVVAAAGNIKYIFDHRTDCERVVRVWTRRVQTYAPGITVSQAVVKVNDLENDFGAAVDQLESRLRIARNRATRPLDLGTAGMLRSRETGRPVVRVLSDDQRPFLDESIFVKLFDETIKGDAIPARTTEKLSCKAFGFDRISSEHLAFEIEDMADANSWIAVVHADGNGLGQIVSRIGRNRELFRQFSKQLDEATTLAANDAYEAVAKDEWLRDGKVIPIRPIVLGGDDLTIICRGDLALPYVQRFLEAFEERTHELLGKLLLDNEIFNAGSQRDCLTACAGIAYVKTAFPFYFAYRLAEQLCDCAKANAKQGVAEAQKDNKRLLPPSCLMFHKVQDSFTTRYADIVERELTPQPNKVSFEAGPYYLYAEPAQARGRFTMEQLLAWRKALTGNEEMEKQANAVTSHLRRWMSELFVSIPVAEQQRQRLLSLLPDGALKSAVEDMTDAVAKTSSATDVVHCPVYDVMTLRTIDTQQTRL